VIYLSGAVRDGLPSIVTPRMRQRPAAHQTWAADNGRFASPGDYDDERYLAWLGSLAEYRADCLFATAPDVVGDAAATLELSLPMLPRIRAAGYPAALVAQDGLEHLEVPWDAFDALFVGGSTAWKLSEAAHELAAEARRRGKWTHMGRVNSWRRFSMAASAGYDSADGTVLRFDPDRPVAEWMRRARAQLGLWAARDA
jgi:hypothetical protein